MPCTVSSISAAAAASVPADSCDCCYLAQASSVCSVYCRVRQCFNGTSTLLTCILLVASNPTMRNRSRCSPCTSASCTPWKPDRARLHLTPHTIEPMRPCQMPCYACCAALCDCPPCRLRTVQCCQSVGDLHQTCARRIATQLIPRRAPWRSVLSSSSKHARRRLRHSAPTSLRGNRQGAQPLQGLLLVRRSGLCVVVRRNAAVTPRPLPSHSRGTCMVMFMSAGTPMAGAVMIDLTALDSDDEDTSGTGWAGAGPASKRRRTSLQACDFVRVLHV